MDVSSRLFCPSFFMVIFKIPACNYNILVLLFDVVDFCTSAIWSAGACIFWQFIDGRKEMKSSTFYATRETCEKYLPVGVVPDCLLTLEGNNIVHSCFPALPRTVPFYSIPCSVPRHMSSPLPSFCLLYFTSVPYRFAPNYGGANVLDVLDNL